MFINSARVALLTLAVSVAHNTLASTAQPVDLSPRPATHSCAA